MTRSISQDTQNDLRVLLESDLSYEEIANRLTLSKATVHRYCKKWNIQRPDNTGGRPQILTEASKSLMKRMDSKPDQKERYLFCQQNTGKHAWNGHLLTGTGLLTTGERLSSLTSRKSTFGALMELNSIGVYLEAHYSLIM
ncbi:hypothetical protein G6F17_012953 [Rhizopus arrhizus]|nr:hypothetical protein G6F17_013328 [Rhizopus arrhizus]KAG0846970.1 hypothetical protein G6F17_012953 [Rhizopus arrhizus]